MNTEGGSHLDTKQARASSETTNREMGVVEPGSEIGLKRFGRGEGNVGKVFGDDGDGRGARYAHRACHLRGDEGGNA